MPEKATNQFDVQYERFDRAACLETVKQASILRYLKLLEEAGTALVGTELEPDTFAKKMAWSYDRVLDLDDQGVVEPPLGTRKKANLRRQRNDIAAFSPDSVPAETTEQQLIEAPEPTDMNTIATSKRKA